MAMDTLRKDMNPTILYLWVNSWAEWGGLTMVRQPLKESAIVKLLCELRENQNNISLYPINLPKLHWIQICWDFKTDFVSHPVYMEGLVEYMFLDKGV